MKNKICPKGHGVMKDNGDNYICSMCGLKIENKTTKNKVKIYKVKDDEK